MFQNLELKALWILNQVSFPLKSQLHCLLGLEAFLPPQHLHGFLKEALSLHVTQRVLQKEVLLKLKEFQLHHLKLVLPQFCILKMEPWWLTWLALFLNGFKLALDFLCKWDLNQTHLWSGINDKPSYRSFALLANSQYEACLPT